MSARRTSPPLRVVTMTVAGQAVGVAVELVQDVLRPQALTRVPMAPASIAGVLNLRGRVVTAIDVRARLDLQPHGREVPSLSAVVEVEGEPYSLLVDEVGEVLVLEPERVDDDMSALTPRWRGVAKAIYKRPGDLLVVLDVARILDVESNGSVPAGGIA